VSDGTIDGDATSLERFAPRGSLKVHALRGGALTVGSQVAKFAITVVGTAVLARLLTPEDYGVVAMVTAVLGFTELFRDLGLSIATVQRQEITQDEVSGLFWINVLTGIALMVIIVAAAPVVAWFYGRPDLVWVTCAYASVAPISSLGSQHQALLQRSMRYGSLAIRDILSRLAGVVAGITAGYLGLGYWALVVMQVTMTVVGVIALWWQSRWRPGRFRWSRRLLSFLRFGGAVALQNILGFLASGLDSILLGYFFGAGDLGIYNRARSLLLRPLEQFMPAAANVATSTFSRLAPDAVRFERSALRLLAIVTCAAGWVVALVMGAAPWIVALLLGAQWTPVIPIVAVLSLFAFVQPSASILATLIVAQGKPDRLVRWRVLSTPITIVLLVAGLPWGPIGVGTTMALGGLLVRTPLFFWYAGRSLGISTHRLLGSTLHYVFAGLLVGLVLIQIRGVWSPQSLFVGLATYGVFGSLLYAVLVLCRREGRALVRDVGTLAASMRAA
jgi:O-antigen/teichoic acid export membrane protein